MCASHLLTPSDPPLSLVFMFRRHALSLPIEHFHPLLLDFGTTSLPWSEALPPLPLSKSLLNIIFFPISWFPFLYGSCLFSSVFPFPIPLCILVVKRHFINVLVCIVCMYAAPSPSDLKKIQGSLPFCHDNIVGQPHGKLCTFSIFTGKVNGDFFARPSMQGSKFLGTPFLHQAPSVPSVCEWYVNSCLLLFLQNADQCEYKLPGIQSMI